MDTSLVGLRGANVPGLPNPAAHQNLGPYMIGTKPSAADSRKESFVSHDPVNHPKHYTSGKIEVIDFLEDQTLGFHLANVVKYIARSAHKGTELQDLRKAAWYLNRKISQLEKE
jgi:hypothetical protein